MTNADLDQVERSLELQLPSEYRTAMLASSVVAHHDSGHVLATTAERLIELNRPELAIWPARLLVVGETSGRDLIYLDVTQSPAPVVRIEAESGRVVRLADDFMDFLGGHRARATGRASVRPN